MRVDDEEPGAVLALTAARVTVVLDASHGRFSAYDLEFRAETAVFGHTGIDWDLPRVNEAETTELRCWLDFDKAQRACSSAACPLVHPDQVVLYRAYPMEDLD